MSAPTNPWPTNPCLTCQGSGEWREEHDAYATETLACPACEGTGEAGGRAATPTPAPYSVPGFVIEPEEE